jgi:tRNA G18 (ribose-2'-O)-methylase SpoU
LGATETVEWVYDKSTEAVVRKLKGEGYSIIAVEQADKSVELQKYSPVSDKPVAVVFGNEIKGVDQGIVNLADAVIEIPQFGTKHSLNVSVSLGIVVWDLINKLCLLD